MRAVRESSVKESSERKLSIIKVFFWRIACILTVADMLAIILVFVAGIIRRQMPNRVIGILIAIFIFLLVIDAIVFANPLAPLIWGIGNISKKRSYFHPVFSRIDEFRSDYKQCSDDLIMVINEVYSDIEAKDVSSKDLLERKAIISEQSEGINKWRSIVVTFFAFVTGANSPNLIDFSSSITGSIIIYIYCMVIVVILVLIHMGQGTDMASASRDYEVELIDEKLRDYQFRNSRKARNLLKFQIVYNFLSMECESFKSKKRKELIKQTIEKMNKSKSIPKDIADSGVLSKKSLTKLKRRLKMYQLTL